MEYFISWAIVGVLFIFVSVLIIMRLDDIKFDLEEILRLLKKD